MGELYRISNDEWLLVLKKYIGEGRGLLPVTIDYEAAAIQSGLWARGMEDFARAHSKSIVDAALGSTDG